MRVHWSTKALSQLDELAEEMQQYSVSAAEKLVNDIIQAGLRLEDFPYLGRAVPESRYPELRELFVRKYRLVYIVGEHFLEIISVLHQAQNR